MKRMKQDINDANFLERGCQYLCDKKFSMVEFKLHGVWTELKIHKLLRNGKVEALFRGVTFSIDEGNEWRIPTCISSWGAKKAPEDKQTKVSPILLGRLGLKDNAKPVAQSVPTQELSM